MNAEMFLNSYRMSLDKLDNLIARKREMEIKMAKTTYGYGDSHGGGDPMENRRNLEADLADIGTKIEKLQGQLKQKRTEVDEFIDCVGRSGSTDERLRKALRLYYCDCFTWREVAQSLRTIYRAKNGTYRGNCSSPEIVSETTIYRIRRDALSAAELAWRRQGH